MKSTTKVLRTLALTFLVGAFNTGCDTTDHKWEAFKKEHKCKVISHEEAKTKQAVGITSGGKTGVAVIQEPSRTTWLCDDGATYTREGDG